MSLSTLYNVVKNLSLDPNIMLHNFSKTKDACKSCKLKLMHRLSKHRPLLLHICP